MEKYLVIVESPAKSKTIRRFLGDDYRIEASFGHVRDLPSGRLGVDVKDNFLPVYTIMKGKKKVINGLKSVSKKVDVVYLATDPDREGEAIAWHIAEEIKGHSDIRRVVFNEITEKAVKLAIQNSRDIDHHLVNAQQARRILDRLIGYKLSPILSKKIRRGLSAGRVQSVSVRLICERERDIQAFQPEEYWVINGVFLTADKAKLPASLFAKGASTKAYIPSSESEANEVMAALKAAEYKVFSVKKTTTRRRPQPPFITSTLQQDAARKLHWSAKKTMMVAQRLYEGVPLGGGEPVGLITYMRTDSVRLSEDALEKAKPVIDERFGPSYYSRTEYSDKKKKGAVVQDAHEAIRPTEPDRHPSSLTATLEADLFRLYQLVWNRFIGSQMKPAVLDRTQVLIASQTPEPYFFKATGHVVVFDGFMKVYLEATEEGTEAKEKDDNVLPKVDEEETVNVSNTIVPEQKFTQPPSRYNEASLVKELEQRGIGRPSTYAPTLSVIQDRGYIVKEGKALHPSELGLTVNDQLVQFFSRVIDYDFTANMETQLDEIMEGKHEWQDIISEFYAPFSDLLTHANEHMEKLKTDKPSDQTCPKCEKPMVIKAGRFGDFLACTGFPDCRHSESIVVNTGLDCPDCGKAITQRHSRRGAVFYGCTGYPDCKFALWDRPEMIPCPECQNPYQLVKVQRDKTETMYCPACKENRKEVLSKSDA